MKKILLGLVAGLSLLAFTVPAHAEGDAAGGDKAAPAEKPAKKKGKKAKKGDDAAAPAGDAPADKK
jgi:hypothetical protein